MILAQQIVVNPCNPWFSFSLRCLDFPYEVLYTFVVILEEYYDHPSIPLLVR